MFDQATLAQLHQNYLATQGQAKGQAPAPKKQTGRGGTLTSLISEGGAVGGGIAGAAAGSVVPVIGTAIGGIIGAGLGAFGGRLAENKIRDNRYGVGDAAKEAALTAVLSGPGKLAKYGATAASKKLAGHTLEDALIAAADKSSAKGMVGNLANKVRTGAGDRYAQSSGFGTGAAYNGKVVTPETQDKLAEFISNRATNYGGIRPGSPMQQARDANTVYKNVTAELDNAVNAIDRPLGSQERTTMAQGLMQRVADDAGVTGTKQISDNYRNKILNARSIKELEAIRKDADNLAFNTKGDVGGTAKAREAGHVRDTIDEFVTGLPDDMAGEYKAIKGDYSVAKQLRDMTSKQAGKKQDGLPLPFLNGGVANKGVGGNFIAGTRNKLDARLAGVNGGEANPLAAAGRQGARMGAQGSLADALLGAQPSNNDAMSAMTTPPSTTQMSTDNIGQDYQTTSDLSAQSPYPRENLLADIQRDPQHADDYIKLYQQYQEVFPEQTSKPLNSTAAGIVADTQTGLSSLEGLYNSFGSSDVNNPVIGKLRSLNPLDTNAQTLNQQIATVKQIVGKALEGGVLRKEDEAKYAKILPTINDTDEVARQKIQYLYGEIANRLNTYKQGIAGGSGGSLEDALLQQTQGAR